MSNPIMSNIINSIVMKLDGMNELRETFYESNGSKINFPAYYYKSNIKNVNNKLSEPGRIPETYEEREVYIKVNGKLVLYNDKTVYFVKVVG